MQPKFTNKLINETSPYLLQHAHNPVDWYPWGEEAFAKAKAEDKPVLVSIGYSACHWCHVMEHESFEDEATAAIMNEHFVSIKVDMEERPDVDQIYMTFVQLTTGRGGWPMNVFVTPDKLPFFGGTYFPPETRYNMPGFKSILMSIAEAYKDKREDLENSAVDILGELRRVGMAAVDPGEVSAELSDAAFNSFVRSFDSVNGGFGGAPKFPPSMSLEFLLRYHVRQTSVCREDEQTEVCSTALEIVAQTAKKMADGGIYDQLGGGFHRYAVDAIWLVPHFEKMLYDNAQLIRIYLHLYQIRSGAGSLESGAGSEAESFKRIAVETLEYVKREMLDASGGFYSSQDADSEDEEGKFFVWTPEEIEAVLGKEDAAEFCKFYDVTAEGNFEGSNILNVKNENAETRERLRASREKLFAEREKRIKPFRDEKILTAWNGLMLAAFAEAARILQSDDYLSIAKRNADFLLENLMVENARLLRTWKDGKAKLNGYLEDYANLADGLIELYQACGDERYLEKAKALAESMITEFWDGDEGGFYFTSNDHEELLVRNKDYYDNATPSGNSVAADVLQKLAKFYNDERFERFAVTVQRLAASQIKRHPQGFGRILSAIEFHLGNAKEIVIVGEKGNELEEVLSRTYLPNSIIMRSSDPKASRLSAFEGREAIGGKATAYVCENFVCGRPVTQADELNDLLNS